jgi:hypothetical protein
MATYWRRKSGLVDVPRAYMKPHSLEPRGTEKMARRTQVILEDDLDGGTADRTVTFAVDGVTYEVDLSEKNADKLTGLLSPSSARAAAPGDAPAPPGLTG